MDVLKEGLCLPILDADDVNTNLAQLGEIMPGELVQDLADYVLSEREAYLRHNPDLKPPKHFQCKLTALPVVAPHAVASCTFRSLRALHEGR